MNKIFLAATYFGKNIDLKQTELMVCPSRDRGRIAQHCTMHRLEDRSVGPLEEKAGQTKVIRAQAMPQQNGKRDFRRG
jgi:hypothetical protein